jgi:Transposase DDE domain
MNEFAGAYGDERRAAAVARLSQQIVSHGSVVIRVVGGDRNGELAAHRVLGSCHVTPRETVACVAQQTARACAGRRVVVPQDTTEVNFPGRINRGLGRVGRLGETPGFFIHAAIAVDADEEAVLGLVAAQIWNRRESHQTPRRERDISAKESHRWLKTTDQAGQLLSEASQIIMLGDRENDIYQAFARRPENVELIIRAAQDRALADGGKLFAAPALWGELAQQTVNVPSRGPGDKGRQATVGLRAGPVRLCRPLHGRNGKVPPEVTLHLVEAREIAPPAGVQPLHWRLLTTLVVQTADDAAEVVRLYRLRWRIEQTFRTLKGDGLKLEECQTQDPWRLLNLAALALDAAVKTIQLVDARDGSNRPASDVASEAEIAAARAICPTLEGNTPRQCNPHRDGSLAHLSWVVARLGGWNCYYKPPGPKTMRRGWDRLKAIAIGFSLKKRGKNVRIP